MQIDDWLHNWTCTQPLKSLNNVHSCLHVYGEEIVIDYFKKEENKRKQKKLKHEKKKKIQPIIVKESLGFGVPCFND